MATESTPGVATRPPLRESSPKNDPGQPVAGDLTRCGKHAHGDGKVQVRPVLPEVPWGQVHNDPAKRPFQGRALDRGPDAIPASCAGAPVKAGQRERGKPSADVRLDGDRVSSHPDDGDAGHFSRTYMECLS
jgi:hypothetical protein